VSRPQAAKGVSRVRLSRCEGFRVEFQGALIGYVDDVHLDRNEKAQSIAVSGCRGFRRLLTISIAEVERVHPEAERVDLRRYPEREPASFLPDFTDELLRAAGKRRRATQGRR
jgi:hypothetical protein